MIMISSRFRRNYDEIKPPYRHYIGYSAKYWECMACGCNASKIKKIHHAPACPARIAVELVKVLSPEEVRLLLTPPNDGFIEEAS